MDKRADIWAFGVVLFEMLTGRRLFGRETVNDLLENEAVLRDRRARLRLATLALGRAWVALRLATAELRF